VRQFIAEQSSDPKPILAEKPVLRNFGVFPYTLDAFDPESLQVTLQQAPSQAQESIIKSKLNGCEVVMSWFWFN